MVVRASSLTAMLRVARLRSGSCLPCLGIFVGLSLVVRSGLCRILATLLMRGTLWLMRGSVA